MQRSHRVAQAIIVISVGITLAGHIWLALSRSDYVTNSEDVDRHQSKSYGGDNTVRISQWRQGSLEAIDSRRIVLHETSGRGYLNVRQSCAVESAARHNPDRPIHVFMRWTAPDRGNSSDTWFTVLTHYNNVEIIQIDDEIKYSNNTALFNWFKTRSRKNLEQSGHLSDYIRSVTLFRGGGLFLDMESVITIKPLNWSKWNNFFVVKRSNKNNERGEITVKMLHLVHGHHLIDEIILNIAKMGVTDDGILGAAIDASVNRICGGDVSWNIKNQCLDVRLIDEDDVFLPPLHSLLWGSLRLAINSNEGHGMLKRAIVNQGAVLMEWDSMASLNRNLLDPMYSSLLEEYCPFTFANAKQFPAFHSSLSMNF